MEPPRSSRKLGRPLLPFLTPGKEGGTPPCGAVGSGAGQGLVRLWEKQSEEQDGCGHPSASLILTPPLWLQDLLPGGRRAPSFPEGRLGRKSMTGIVTGARPGQGWLCRCPGGLGSGGWAPPLHMTCWGPGEPILCSPPSTFLPLVCAQGPVGPSGGRQGSVALGAAVCSVEG